MEPDDLQLRDLAPAEPFLQSPGWPWWVWAVGALAGLALVILVIIICRRKKTAQPPDLKLRAEKAYREALGEIERAGTLQVAQDAATACSSALRRYLSTVCGDPSLFETHEEFLARHKALESFPSEVRDSVSSNFNRLAALKYGKSSNTEIPSLAEDGRGLLDQLHQQKTA